MEEQGFSEIENTEFSGKSEILAFSADIRVLPGSQFYLARNQDLSGEKLGFFHAS